MGADSLASTRRIHEPIKDFSDIQSAFEGITHQKGGATLGMFEQFIGSIWTAAAGQAASIACSPDIDIAPSRSSLFACSARHSLCIHCHCGLSEEPGPVRMKSRIAGKTSGERCGS